MVPLHFAQAAHRAAAINIWRSQSAFSNSTLLRYCID
jgi:hypothetical protein